MPRVLLPDGTYEDLPDDATEAEIEQYLAYKRERHRQRTLNRERERQPSPSNSGLGSLRSQDRRSERADEDEGTLLGAAFQGLKNIPRGAQQFGLSALQGFEALKTPGSDTAREKELRRKLNELYASQDPRYADSNLAQLGMGLGQVGAMVGTSLIPYVGPGIALGGATLMGAGEAAGRIADYEARTGEDVSSSDEIKALTGGLALGVLEMAGPGRLAKLAKPLTRSARRLLPATGARAADAIESAGQLGLVGREARDYITSGLKATAIEGVQEGASSFGQSLLAKQLYDEDALADAPSNALKEAIIGGQVGGVADVLLRMAGGRRRMKTRQLESKMEAAVATEAKKAWEEKEDGAFDRATFIERVNSQDPVDQQFIAEIEDGTLLEEADRQSQQRQEDIMADTELDDAERSEQLEGEVKKATLAQNLLTKMSYGVQAVRQDNLADEGVSPEAPPETLPETPSETVSETQSRRQDELTEILVAAENQELTPAQAAFIGETDMIGVALVSDYDPMDVLAVIEKVAPQAPPPEVIAEAEKAAEEGVRFGPAEVRSLAGETTTTEQEMNEVVSAVLGFDALADFGTEVVDRPVSVENIDISDREVDGIIEQYKKAKGKVSKKLAEAALGAKAIGQTLEEFTVETLELDENVAWDKLQDGEQQAVFSRILRSDVQEIEGGTGKSPLTPEQGLAVLSYLSGVIPEPVGGAAEADADIDSFDDGGDMYVEGVTKESLGLPDKPLLSQVGNALEARARGLYGRLLDPKGDKDEIVRVLADEVELALSDPESAAEWYQENLEAAFQIWADERPEIRDDPILRDAARLSLAVSSNGAAVIPNAANAIKIFDFFVENGKFPTTMGLGKEAGAVDRGFATMNDIMDAIGKEDAFRFLDTVYSVGDLKKAGLSVTGETVDSNMPGSIIFGPKIGGAFYRNLGGFFNEVTMDRWFRRTIGRITGDMMEKYQPETIVTGRERLRKAGLVTHLKNPPARTVKGVKKKGIPSLLTASEAQAMRINKNASDKDIEASSVQYVQIWEKMFSENSDARKAAKLNKTKVPARLDKPEWALAAETHLKHVQPQIREAPKSGTERTELRAVVNELRLEVNRRTGIEYNNAAIQALLWYPEKRLYIKLGIKQKDSDVGYEEAFDRAFPRGLIKRRIVDDFTRPITRRLSDEAKRTAFGDGATDAIIPPRLREAPLLAARESTEYRSGFLASPGFNPARRALSGIARSGRFGETGRLRRLKLSIGKNQKNIPKAAKALAEDIGAEPTQVRNYIKRLISRGLVEYTGTGTSSQVQLVSPENLRAPVATEQSIEQEQRQDRLVEEGVPRTDKEFKQHAKSLVSAKKRIDSFKLAARKNLAKMGKPDVGIKIAVAVDSIYAKIEDIYNDPDIIVQSKAYDTGPSAEVRNHGAMVLFNLSQMERTSPDGSKTDIDTLVSDTAFHEGAHLWYLNDDLTRAEQKSLEKYGKSQRVPKAVDGEAYNKELTWRQWTESIYGESDPNIVEETSVRILDALAADKIPQNKSAGVMGKIYRDLRARAEALVRAANDSDVLPAIEVFAKVQDGEIKRRSEEKDIEFKGMSPTQILARSAPDQYQALKEAAETGDEGELAAAAKAIVRSKSDGPTITLQQSLLNDLRARREIEETPGSVMPVLNQHNIEEGRISAAALNAYFDFNDQSVRPYSFLEGTRYKQGEEGYQGQQMLLAQSGEREGGPNEGIRSAKDFDERMEYTALDILRTKLVDKRLPQWFSEKQKAAREGAHKILAYASAIAAWRQADNALLYTDGIMENGPLQWIRDRDDGDRANGGLSLDGGLEVDGRPVKGMKAIAAPVIAKGEKFVAELYDFLTAHRIVDVNEKKLEAQRKLAAAQKVDAEALALNPPPAPNPDLLPPAKLPSALQQAAPNYRKGILRFDSDIDKAAYIVGSRKTLSKKDDRYVAWLAERGVSLEEAKVLHGRVVAIAKSEYRGEEGQAITVPADPFANRQFNPTVVRPPGSTAPSTLEKLEREARKWEEDYELINPKNPKKKGNPRTVAIKDAKALIRRVETGGGDARILTQFKQDYSDFNYWMVEFLYETGEITLDKKLTLQELSYVPFHRDQGWADAQSLVNTKNKNVRGPSMIERELTGSVAPLDRDLFGQITDNVTAIVRDGLLNIATQRSVRDELGNKTAMEIRPSKAAEDNEVASELGFSDVAIRVKVDGKTRIFRVKDPLLSQSIMTMGFNPVSAIEDFYGSVFRAGNKTLGMKNEAIVTGLTALSTGPSKLLRELVTRSPPFIAKNILRDSMSASVVYGGGPLMTLKALRNVFLDGDLLEKARARGLGQPIDYVTDPSEFDSRAQTLLTQDEIRGLTNGIPVVSTVWDALGQASRKSEVATRMAVYDAVIRDTTTEAMPQGDRVEALHQATEIMNYGRRGSSPLFSVLTAMAPFMNGRIQGLDVVLRTHLASQDSPGLYDKEFDDTAAGRLRQAGTAASRGAYLAFGTFLYWLAVHDDEEYKNTPSDLKNDWWLIPMPGSRLGVKIPIPFEIGVLYKVIPEQILRTLSEDEHDFGDMTTEMKRQVTSTLWMDIRPQAIRPMLDAAANRNSFSRGQIVPTWMNNSVAASEQYNPATNEIARLISGSLDSIPVLKGMDFLTSPMKMEYMLRQYGGTLGTYAMVLADRATREAGGRNIVGTPADFGFGSIDKMPMLGDLLYDSQSGGGYQESFYDMVEDVDQVVATLREMEGREDRDRGAEERYEDENRNLFRVEGRLSHFDKRMDHWRRDRDRLFTRKDLSDEDKRRALYRMYESRDEILSEMLNLMGTVRGVQPDLIAPPDLATILPAPAAAGASTPARPTRPTLSRRPAPAAARASTPAQPTRPALKRRPAPAAAGAPTPAQPTQPRVSTDSLGTGTVYTKNGRAVYDSANIDPSGTTVPTHFVDEISQRLAPGQTVEDLEAEVLATPEEDLTDKKFSREINDLASDVADSAKALLLAAERAGFRLTVNETMRSQDRQDFLFQQGRSRDGNVVTWTLTSNHSNGRALDLRSSKPAGYQWLQDNAGSFGFDVLGAKDIGHISMGEPDQ